MCVKKKKLISYITEVSGHRLGQGSVDRKSELHSLPKGNKSKDFCLSKECTLTVSYLRFENERNKKYLA